MVVAEIQRFLIDYLEFLRKQPTIAVCDCQWEERLYPGGITRPVIASENPICPVHSKEGLILGFTFWLWHNANVDFNTLDWRDYDANIVPIIINS